MLEQNGNGKTQYNLTHGLTTQANVVLTGENNQEYQTMVEQLATDCGATSPLEYMLVKQMADALWKKARLDKIERDYIDGHIEDKKAEIQETVNNYYRMAMIQTWQAEVKLLQQIRMELYSCIAETDRINRNRNPKYFQKSTTTWCEKLKGILDKFLDQYPATMSEEEQEDHKKKLACSQRGHFLKQIKAICKSLTRTYGLNMLSLSTTPLQPLLDTLNERYKTVSEQLEDWKNHLETKRQLFLSQNHYMLEEETYQKFRRYETTLENQFYRALTQLQRQQVFTLQRNQLVAQKNELTSQNGRFLPTSILKLKKQPETQ